MPQFTPLEKRIWVSVVIGLAAGVLAFVGLINAPALLAHDFSYPWYAARAVLGGQNPYDAVAATDSVLPFRPWLLYPMPAVLVAAPVAPLPPSIAGGAFFGVSSGLLAYGVLKGDRHHLPIFLHASYFRAMMSLQWSPLLAAAALVPGALGWLAAAKPTSGFAALLYRPKWSAFIGAAMFAALSLLVLPRWPLDWLEAIRHSPRYELPIMYPGGFLVLLTLLRWRTPEARVVLVMACVPQAAFYYDQLLLALAARTTRQSLFLAACSWVAYGLMIANGIVGPARGEGLVRVQPYISLGLYLPATLVVLHPDRQSMKHLYHLARAFLWRLVDHDTARIHAALTLAFVALMVAVAVRAVMR